MKKIILFAGLFYGIFASGSPSYSQTEKSLDAPSNLLIEAENFYQNERHQNAIESLQTAIKEYRQVKDTFNEINTRRNLALVYQTMGESKKAKKNIQTNLKQINNLEDSQEQQELKASSLEVLKEINLESGQTESAIEVGQEITNIYQKLGDKQKENRSKINVAIALSSLGLYNQAQNNLLEVQQDLEGQPESIKIVTLSELGKIFIKTGNLSRADESLKQGLELAKKADREPQIATFLISLGDLNQVNKNPTAALNYYQQALAIAREPQIKISARLKQLKLSLDRGLWQEELSGKIERDLEKIPVSRTKTYAQINLAEQMIRHFKLNKELKNNLDNKAEKILNQAITQAKQIEDPRAISYAHGTLAHLYEQQNRYQQAKVFTEIALVEANTLNAAELSYQWQWQLGRIAEELGQRQRAIAAYSQSVNNLQSLRGDLVAISDEVQFTFSESVEPVYRELVDLLLKENDPSPSNLEQARNVIEQLQLARLNNYFREACLDAVPQKIDTIDRQASVIYSIILSDRLALILSVPGKGLIYQPSFFQEKPTAKIEQIVDNIYSDLDFFDPEISYDRQPYRELHDLLIAPIAANLQDNEVETLVFVMDGILQRVPVAAIFDGEKYLIEKYNVVLTPGLQLLKSPNLSPERLRTVFAGISEARSGFSPLPGVKQEAQEIARSVPTKVLLDRDFTSEQLKTQIGSNPFPIVHLATHGEFSSRAEDTFLLAWDRKINVKELDRLLGVRNRLRENPIELLILSACETAEGDNRAALGIAGVALRSGARSTIASLWAVQDDSTTLLMERLYSQLNQPGINKARALRNAQLSLLKDSEFVEPYYWAAFALIGNWL